MCSEYVLLWSLVLFRLCPPLGSGSSAQTQKHYSHVSRCRGDGCYEKSLILGAHYLLPCSLPLHVWATSKGARKIPRKSLAQVCKQPVMGFTGSLVRLGLKLLEDALLKKEDCAREGPNLGFLEHFLAFSSFSQLFSSIS